MNIIKRILSALYIWPFNKIGGGITRTGRVLLWIGFWPLGLWRSIVHSQRKNHRKLEG